MIAKVFVILLGVFLVVGSLFSCSETPTNNGKDTCDTCDTTTPCDTCDTTKPNLDSLSHAFTWTEYTIPGVSSLTGVAVFSDSRIYAFGNDLHIFDGTKWTTTPAYVGSSTRRATFIDSYVFSFSESNYWVVNGNLIYNGDGKFVEEYRFTSGSNNNFRSCWGASSKDMFFVGDTGLVMHFDGTTWTKMPRVTTKNLYSVWGTSHSDVWAAGFNYSTAESVLLHYNGSTWTEQNLKEIGDIRPFNHALGEVWATDSSGHKIVIASGSLLHRKTDNNLWRSDSGYIKNRVGDGLFIGLWHTNGNGINDFCSAGDGGFISHWNGKTWKRYDDIFNSGDPLYVTNAMSMKGNTICMVGKRNGGSWIAIGRRKPF
jgi:hypothetical protein